MSRSDGTQIPGSSTRAGSDQVEEARLQPAQFPETPKAAEKGESPGKDFIPCSWDEDSERRDVEMLVRVQRDLGTRLSGTTDLQEGLRLCVEAALKVSGMDCGGVYLVDESSGALDLVFDTGLPLSFVKETAHYDAGSLGARLIMAGKPVYSSDQELCVPLEYARRREMLRAIAVVPMFHEGHVIGCLNLASRTNEIPFFAREALETIASRMSSAIVRLKTDEQLEEYRWRLEELVGERTSELRSANERLSREVAERKRSEEALRNIAEGVSANVGEEFFRSLVLHLAETLNVDYAFVGELVGEEAERVRTIAAYAKGVVTDNIEYELAGTPCENVVARSVCSHAHGVQELFPRDHMLAEMGVESYVGAPLFNSAGCSLGIVVVLDSRPLSNPELAESMLQIFAVRASAELERRRAAEALLESEQLLRTIFDSVKDEIVLVDANGTVLDVNQRVFDITGFSPDEVIGRNFADPDFLDADELQRLSELFAVSVAQGRAEALPIEAQVKHRHGRRVPVEVTTNALSAADGTLSGFVSISRDITERKRAEEALQESEERFRLLYENAPIPYQSLDEDGCFIEVNEAWLDTLGYSRDEVIGQWFGEFLPDDYRQVFREQFPRFKKLGAIFGAELEVRCKDGSFRIASFDGKIATDEAGLFRQTHCVFHDITERKRMEEALRESEERFRSLYSAMAEGVALHEVIYDESGQAVDYVVTDVSPSFEQILGIKREEAVGSRASELYGTGEAPFLDIYARTADTGEPAHLETYFPPLDKHFAISVICPAKGKFATIFFDVTERKQAAEALQKAHDEMEGQVRERTADLTTANAALRQEIVERKQAEEEGQMLAAVVRHTSELVNLSTLDGRMVFLNEAGGQMLGIEPDKAGDHSILEVIPDDIIEMVKREIFPNLMEGGTWSGVLQYRNLKTGGVTDVDAITFTIKDPQTGKPVLFANVSHDITERKQAEEELRRSSEQLREFSTRLESVRETERTTIARDIHDDLGQVLTVLKMGLSALEKRLAPEQQPLIERTKSMSQIVDGAVKQVQRICSELRPRLLDDLGLTAAIEWQAQDFAERTGIRCDVAPESADVVTDRECATAVFRVFQEALTNVARHANASRVRVHLKRVNGSIELEVNDNGRGISREQVSAFHSLGLTGMGERARSLGGEVTISGRPNKGTTVALTIPVERQEGGDD